MSLKKYASVSPTAFGIGGSKRIAVVRTSGAKAARYKSLNSGDTPHIFARFFGWGQDEQLQCGRPVGAIVSGGGGGAGGSGQITADTVIKQLRAIGKQKVPSFYLTCLMWRRIRP